MILAGVFNSQATLTRLDKLSKVKNEKSSTEIAVIKINKQAPDY